MHAVFEAIGVDQGVCHFDASWFHVVVLRELELGDVFVVEVDHLGAHDELVWLCDDNGGSTGFKRDRDIEMSFSCPVNARELIVDQIQ